MLHKLLLILYLQPLPILHESALHLSLYELIEKNPLGGRWCK